MIAALTGTHQISLGADKSYEPRGVIGELCRVGITPHVVLNSGRSGGYAMNRSTTSHRDYGKLIHSGRHGLRREFLKRM